MLVDQRVHSNLFASRNGITPIVSIILLLMMAVAATGAVYNWFTNIQDDVKSDVEQDLQTSLQVRDLQCNVNSGEDTIELALKNAGNRQISARQVDVFVYDQTNHLNVTLINLDWSDKAFTDPGGFETVTADVSQSGMETSLYEGSFYSVEIDFMDASQVVSAGSCLGE